MHFDIPPLSSIFHYQVNWNACFVNRIYKLDSDYITKKVGRLLPFCLGLWDQEIFMDLVFVFRKSQHWKLAEYQAKWAEGFEEIMCIYL